MATSGSDVRKLVGCSLTDDELSVYISVADRLVERELPGKGLSEATMGDIALFLAGHFYVVGAEGGGVTGTSIGAASESYRSFMGDGFMSTRFGQMACALDTSGVLKSMSAAAGTEFIFKHVAPSYTTARGG